MASDIVITPNRGSTTVNAKIDFTGASTASSQIRLEVLPDNSLSFVGTTGSLFSIADSVTGSLMSVNDASGLPILEVFDTDKVVMGQYNQNTLVVNGTNVGIGAASPASKLEIRGGTANQTNDATVYITADNDNDWALVVDKNRSAASEYGLRIITGSAASYALGVYGGGSLSTRIAGNGDIYAPRMYDSTATAYYVDPGSTSNLNGLTVAATITGNAATASSAAAITGGMPSGTDYYINLRVIRNNNAATTDGMYIGYGNAGSGLTRLYGGGSSTNHAYVDVNGDIWRSSGGYQYVYNSGTWSGVSIGGNAATSTTWQTARNFTIGSTARSVNGSSDYSWTVADIGAAVGLPAYQAWSFDSVKTPGLYQYDGGIGATKPPDGSANYRTIEVGSSTRYSQIALPWDSDNMYFRRQTNSTWSTWRTVLTDGNYTSYVGNGTLTLNTSGNGLSGSTSFTANQSGAGTFTVTSNATSSNAYNTIVYRDGSGNFAAGTITADLSGTATYAGMISGNIAAGTSKNIVDVTVGDNDYFKITVGSTSSNAGYVEFSTYDDGTEPIRFVQSGIRTLTLLDSSGNTTIPGTLTVSGASVSIAGNTAIHAGNYTSYTIPYSGSGRTVSGWMISGVQNGTAGSPLFYLSHSGGYGMHINTYNTSGSIYAMELHSNTKQLFVVYNDGSIYMNGGNAAIHAGNYTSYVGNGTLTLNTSGNGISGSTSFTANQSGNTTFTVTSNATASNTANTIVLRDGSGNIFGQEYYAGGWYRSYSTQGIYNQDYQMHFYADSTEYYNIANNSTSSGGLKFRSSHQGTVKGFVYWDSAGVGLLSNTGNWAVRSNYGSQYAGGSLYGAWDKRNASNTGGITVPGVFIQSGATSGAPSAIQNGDLWWNTDTGKLKIYWSTASAWVDATPVPDMAGYYTTGGGNINGNVNVNGLLESTGNINARVGQTHSLSLGTHPSYGASWVGLWRTGSDYALITNSNNTLLNAPTGSIGFRVANSEYAYVNSNGVTTNGSFIMSGGFTLSQNGAYGQTNNWIHLNGYHGLYSGNNSAHIYPNNNSSYGSWGINGSRNSYGGIYDAYSGVAWMHDSGGNGGLYKEANSRWYIYYNHSTNNCLGIGSSATTSGYVMQVNGNSYVTGYERVGGGNLYIDGNYGRGVVGLYASTRYQGVFAMGDSYKLADDGTTTGTLYGIAWSHPNAGGAAANLASHGMLILENGTFKGAWGGGRLVTTEEVRATKFVDYTDTNYFIDPDNTEGGKVKYSFTVSGAGSSAGYGLALYPSYVNPTGSNTCPTYGIMFASTATYGTHGAVNSANDWSTFFTMNNTAGRGWIFRDVSGSTNVASISNAGRMRISSLGVNTDPSATAGEIRATDNITAYYSDERLKTKLGAIENPIEKVKALSGFYFEANETAVALGYQKKREVGVSAQEVQAILPEIIAPAPIDDKYMTVRYEKLIPLLIEAIKAQQAQIEELQKLIKEKV